VAEENGRQAAHSSPAGLKETIEETFTFHRLPRQHHKDRESINMLERLDEEIDRRAIVSRIVSNEDGCQRLIGVFDARQEH
jgi:transposase-like protein